MSHIILMASGVLMFGIGVIGWITDHTVEKTEIRENQTVRYVDSKTGNDLAWYSAGSVHISNNHKIVLRKNVEKETTK